MNGMSLRCPWLLVRSREWYEVLRYEELVFLTADSRNLLSNRARLWGKQNSKRMTPLHRICCGWITLCWNASLSRKMASKHALCSPIKVFTILKSSAARKSSLERPESESRLSMAVPKYSSLARPSTLMSPSGATRQSPKFATR